MLDRGCAVDQPPIGQHTLAPEDDHLHRDTDQEKADLKFAFTVCKHTKSNAIIYVKDRMTVGIGAGQMSRVDSCIISVRKAGERAKGSVLASDAYFPFPDGIEIAGEAGVSAIIQPGGSINDKEVIPELLQKECNPKEIFRSVTYFLKNPILIDRQIDDYKKTLDEIRSKTSSTGEASAILAKYLVL